MVGGRGIRKDVPGGEVNMALVPRQTGSSIKAFILAAAYEAGAQTRDIINGPGPCTVPDFVDGVEQTKTVEAKAGELGPLNGPNTWSSSDCGFVRLSYAVGLHRVVDSVYRIAHSPYFYQGQPTTDREPFQPLPLTATGNNAMAPIDMAAGMQTILNKGLHQDPYYVQWIDRADGTRFFSHIDQGVQALDEGPALNTITSLKGVIKAGTGARNLRQFPRPAAGKTGTQFENTNAWFVGGTPQLTTAVWVGDPNGYTPMDGIPEFRKEMGRNGKVQGADYPARIWGRFMEDALALMPEVDWPPPPKATRVPARIFVPGEECPAKVVSGTIPNASTTTVAPNSSVSTSVATSVGAPTESSGPSTTAEPAVAVVVPITGYTTVPADELDPRAPMPSVDLRTYVYVCEQPPENVVVRKKGT
jgi:penicillin-binding protein 1A